MLPLSAANGVFVSAYGCMVLYTANTSNTYFNGMPSLTLAPQCSAFTSIYIYIIIIINTLTLVLSVRQSVRPSVCKRMWRHARDRTRIREKVVTSSNEYFNSTARCMYVSRRSDNRQYKYYVITASNENFERPLSQRLVAR